MKRFTAVTPLIMTHQILFSAIVRVIAQPTSGHNDTHLPNPNWYDPTEHDEIWSESSRYSFSELLGEEGRFVIPESNETEASHDSMQVFMESSIEPTTSSSTGFITSRRGRKGKHYIDRELGFARVRLGHAEMSLDQWRELLSRGDEEALRIKMEHDVKCDKECAYAALLRKLKKHPNDVELLAKLKDFKVTEEYYWRQRSIAENKLPLSKPTRDKLNTLIHKVRRDIQDHNASKRLRGLRTVMTEKKVIKAKKMEAEDRLNRKHAAGNACADQIIASLSRMRVILRSTPLDRCTWDLLAKEVDRWMSTNQINYTPLDQLDFGAGIDQEYAGSVEIEETQRDSSYVDRGTQDGFHQGADMTYQDNFDFELSELDKLIGSSSPAPYKEH